MPEPSFTWILKTNWLRSLPSNSIGCKMSILFLKMSLAPFVHYIGGCHLSGTSNLLRLDPMFCISSEDWNWLLSGFRKPPQNDQASRAKQKDLPHLCWKGWNRRSSPEAVQQLVGTREGSDLHWKCFLCLQPSGSLWKWTRRWYHSRPRCTQ